jgi:hypothetical protein
MSKFHLPIIQKNQTHVTYDGRIEAIMDVLVHNPTNNRIWWKRLSNGTYYNQSVKAVTSIIQPFLGFRFKDYKFHYIGVSHLDACWLWPVVDTKIRAWKTFNMAVENIEKFPFFHVSLSTRENRTNRWNVG